ncbi:hypothetical protein LAZ67_7001946, partial [Cordylochernes scorpioides]
MTWPYQASLRWIQTPLPGGRATCPMVADLTTSQSPRWTQMPLPCKSSHRPMVLDLTPPVSIQTPASTQTPACLWASHKPMGSTTDRRVRSHPPQCTTSRADRQIVRMAVTDRSVTSRTVAQHIQSVTHHPMSARTIRRRLQQSGLSARRPLLRLPLTQNHRRLHRQWCDERRMWMAEWNEIVFTDDCVMNRYTGPAPGIMIWGGIGYHSRTPLVRIAGTLNRQRYISEVLEPVVLPYLQDLPTAIFQQDNARPHVARIVQRFFINRHIELLPWPARSPELSPIENMWSMVAQQLTQITSPAATPDQLWQRVESAWSAVTQEHIQSLFESMPRRVAANASGPFLNTINNGLIEAELRSRRPLVIIPLSAKHRSDRLNWCEERRLWTQEWNSVIFRDESKFSLGVRDGNVGPKKDSKGLHWGE